MKNRTVILKLSVNKSNVAKTEVLDRVAYVS